MKLFKMIGMHFLKVCQNKMRRSLKWFITIFSAVFSFNKFRTLMKHALINQTFLGIYRWDKSIMKVFFSKIWQCLLNSRLGFLYRVTFQDAISIQVCPRLGSERVSRLNAVISCTNWRLNSEWHRAARNIWPRAPTDWIGELLTYQASLHSAQI